jgi:hypothetical protein
MEERSTSITRRKLSQLLSANLSSWFATLPKISYLGGNRIIYHAGYDTRSMEYPASTIDKDNGDVDIK